MARKVSNADAAKAINSILHFSGADQEALLEVIGDYFYEGRGDTEEDEAQLLYEKSVLTDLGLDDPTGTKHR